MRLGETRLFRRFSGQVNEDIDAAGRVGDVPVPTQDRGTGGHRARGRPGRDRRERHAPERRSLRPAAQHDLLAQLARCTTWASIVCSGRIAYAGVQFPLAESGELEKELGLAPPRGRGHEPGVRRGRAGRSEETGDISIAERGQLIRKLTPEAPARPADRASRPRRQPGFSQGGCLGNTTYG